MTKAHFKLAKKYIESVIGEDHPYFDFMGGIDETFKDEITLQQFIDELKDLVLVLENEDELTSWDEDNNDE